MIHKNKLQNFFILSVFAAIGVCSLILSHSVFAEGGSSETHGGTSCSGGVYDQKDKKGYHNCCAKGASCPHYIYLKNKGGGTNQDFVDAVNAGEDAAGFKANAGYAACKKDPDGVVVVGTDYGHTRATNWHAPSGNDYKTFDGWGDHAHINMNDTFPGTNHSYNYYKNEYLNKSGTTEYNLAFFCPSLVDDPETTFSSNSYVKVTVKLPNNIPASISNFYRNLLGGDKKTQSFQVYESGSDWTNPRNEKMTVDLVAEMFQGETPPLGTEVTVNYMQKVDVGTDTDFAPTSEKKRKTEWKITYSQNANVDSGQTSRKNRGATSGTLTFSNSTAQTAADYIDGGMVKFTVKSKGKTYKSCERIDYGYKTKKGKTASLDNSKHSEICITIKGDEPPPGDCKYMNNNAAWGMTYSNSDAQSWVKKSSDSDWTHQVYARPRERVAFLHCYYAYAHGSQASLSWAGKNQNSSPGSEDHGYHYPAVYHPRTCCGEFSCWDCSYYTRTRTSNASNRRISRDNLYDYCELKASGTNDGNYLLNRGNDNEDKSLCNGSTKTIHTSKSSAVIQLKSPYKNSNDYGCSSNQKGYYQIVGFDPRSQCSKAGSTTSVYSGSDAGYTFSQWIYYGGTLTTSSTPRMDYDAGLPAHYSYFYEVTQRNEGYRDGTPASVIVPYNFNTTAAVTDNARKIVYPGEPVSFGTNVEITPRYNPDVDPTELYATNTPRNSKIMTVQFTLDPYVSAPSDLKGGISSNGNANSVANYISSKVGAGFRSYVTDTIQNGPFNGGDKTSGLTNDNGKAITNNVKYTVPDDEPGVKYCFAVAVYPADSHNKRIGEDLKSGDNNDGSGQEGRTSWRWRVSDIKCTTIAKKPNVQIWGSGIYSAGSISSSTSTKCLGWTISTQQSCNNNSKRTFGSWAENEVIANDVIVNFASSNGYGYDDYFKHNDYYNSGTLAYGGLPGGNTSSSFSDVMKQTISNTQSGSGGYANIDISPDVLDRILGRYGSSQPAGYYGGVYDNNNATSTAGPIVLAPGDGTVVIYSTKNFTIKHDIVVSDGSYSDIADIPQVLIIAPNISIASNVTRVDAWLVSTNRVSGIVNTCKEFKSGQTASDGDCNSPLTINGPIFAMKMLFNRTAGAGVDNNSINPAERINLSAANYLWAYSQAEQLNQAFTTYMRELAPRY